MRFAVLVFPGTWSERVVSTGRAGVAASSPLLSGAVSR
jgi:hypothetical protein